MHQGRMPMLIPPPKTRAHECEAGSVATLIARLALVPQGPVALVAGLPFITQLPVRLTRSDSLLQLLDFQPDRFLHSDSPPLVPNCGLPLPTRRRDSSSTPPHHAAPLVPARRVPLVLAGSIEVQ